MALIIDTCNVLHRTGILPPDLAGEDLHGLLSLISTSRYGELDVVFACDWGPAERRSTPRGPRVRYVFPEPGKSADDIILELVDRSTAPRRLLVVTSDRRVAALARRGGRARVIDADRFLEQLVSDARRAPRDTGRNRPRQGGTPGDAEAWLDAFDVDPAMRSIEGASIPKPPPRPTPSEDPSGSAQPSDPPRTPAEWEQLDTDELLRRYERGEPGDDGTT